MSLRNLGVIVTMLLGCSLTSSFSQSNDSTQLLDDVIVRGYLSRQPILEVPASVALLDSKALLNGSQQTLLPILNTIPGIRMEERSPGSYRLSIRGSLLRSPFGVRNVKMYLNDLPFTDASGNTYLNLIDPELLKHIEILKGPDGSLFGANSGGVVLLNSQLSDSSSIEGSLSQGSYGLFRERFSINQDYKKVQWNFGEAYQKADGYREQSAMKRLNLFGSTKIRYGERNSVNITALFSDLHYETPGGLTKEQYDENPSQARLGATQKKSGIYNTTFFYGATNEYYFSASLRHVISGFGTITNYENPFISNYEIRKESNSGFRTFLAYQLSKGLITMNAYLGTEGQFGFQNIANYGNVDGKSDTLMSKDDVTVFQGVYFSKLQFDIGERLTAELAVSLNQYQYTFNETAKRSLSNQWMPRIAMSYRFVPEFALRASISKGYSPPTLAEIRPSGSIINQILQAESGWNKEVGARLSSWNGRLNIDASVFRYDLDKAIVRRADENDQEFFLNSGGTKQTGVELLVNTIPIPSKPKGFVTGMSINLSYSYSHFRFNKYVIDTIDYSLNRLTGVPRTTFVAGLSIDLVERVNIFVQSNFTSHIPLNDANSQYAGAYQLLQSKITWAGVKREKFTLQFFLGADNLLNQKYSLGNDINAFGSRYYNAAMPRNFYGGVKAQLQ